MSDFALAFKNTTEKHSDKLSDYVGLTIIKLHEKVDSRSPVGDPTKWDSPPPPGYVGGRFRANWQLGVGSAPEGEVAGIDDDGSKTRDTVTASLPGDGKNAGPVYYLVNNLPYAERLEDGHSTQAPLGMVGLAVAEFPQLASTAKSESGL